MPLVNLINGGKPRGRAAGVPGVHRRTRPGPPTFAEALAESSEVNLALGEVLEARYGRSALSLGDEGGYVPPVSDPREALELLHLGVEKAGHTGRFQYGLDCAATHFYDAGENLYRLGGQAVSARPT